MGKEVIYSSLDDINYKFPNDVPPPPPTPSVELSPGLLDVETVPIEVSDDSAQEAA